MALPNIPGGRALEVALDAKQMARAVRSVFDRLNGVGGVSYPSFEDPFRFHFYLRPCGKNYVSFGRGLVDLEIGWYYHTLEHEAALYPFLSVKDLPGYPQDLSSPPKKHEFICSFVDEDFNPLERREVFERMKRLSNLLEYIESFLPERGFKEKFEWKQFTDSRRPVSEERGAYQHFLAFLLQVSGYDPRGARFSAALGSLKTEALKREYFLSALLASPETKFILSDMRKSNHDIFFHSPEAVERSFAFSLEYPKAVDYTPHQAHSFVEAFQGHTKRWFNASRELFEHIHSMVLYPRSRFDDIKFEHLKTMNPRHVHASLYKTLAVLGKMAKLLFR